MGVGREPSREVPYETTDCLPFFLTVQKQHLCFIKPTGTRINTNYKKFILSSIYSPALPCSQLPRKYHDNSPLSFTSSIRVSTTPSKCQHTPKQSFQTFHHVLSQVNRILREPGQAQTSVQIRHISVTHSSAVQLRFATAKCRRR